MRPGEEMNAFLYTCVCVHVQALCEDITKADIDAVIADLLHLYNLEAKCI